MSDCTAGLVPPCDLFLAVPTYDGTRHNASAIVNATMHRGPFRGIRADDSGGSLLTLNFNRMWANALNAREVGVTHFLMLHSDVYPHPATWVADLFAVMERVEAQVLSAVLPIKDARGVTSTAIERSNIWAPQRITLRELEAQPPTFTHPGLLVNTGMMLIDMREPWVEKVYFDVNNRIGKNDSGVFYAAAEAEDWFFSRRAREQGARIFATREIAATHYGRGEFPNFGAWGQLDRDEPDVRNGVLLHDPCADSIASAKTG